MTNPLVFFKDTNAENGEAAVVENGNGEAKPAAKKKKRNRNKKKQQTNPPTIPVNKLFTNGKFPLGEEQDYPAHSNHKLVF